MPQLANAQHEAFAQAVVSGCSLTEAAKRSGHTNGPGNHGSRLVKVPQVQQRILELQAGPVESGETTGKISSSAAPSQDVLVYTSKPWVTVQLVAVERLARKARDYGVSHAVLKTLAQIGGHLDGNSRVSDPTRDPQRLALMGIKEIHSMLSQVVGSAPRHERARLLAEAPALEAIVAEIPEAAEPETPAQD